MDIVSYKELIKSFINRKVTVDEFEKDFLAAFKTEPGPMNPSIYDILENLFAAVDAYWYECLPGQETAFTISEDMLREEANQALLKLDQ